MQKLSLSILLLALFYGAPASAYIRAVELPPVPAVELPPFNGHPIAAKELPPPFVTPVAAKELPPFNDVETTYASAERSRTPTIAPKPQAPVETARDDEPAPPRASAPAAPKDTSRTTPEDYDPAVY